MEYIRICIQGDPAAGKTRAAHIIAENLSIDGPLELDYFSGVSVQDVINLATRHRSTVVLLEGAPGEDVRAVLAAYDQSCKFHLIITSQWN